LFSSAAHEKSADLVDESGVIASSADRLDVGSVVLIEIDGVWCELHFFCVVGATLPKVIIAPGEYISKARHHQRVGLAT